MSDNDEKKSTSSNYDDVVIESEQLGVYHVLIATTKAKGLQYMKYSNELKSAVPHLARFFVDIYKIAPNLLIELGFVQGTPLASEILWSLGLRMLCMGLVSYLSWLSTRIQDQLRSRAVAHFDLYLIEVKARLDLPTALDASCQVDDISGYTTWQSFSGIIEFLSSLLTAASQTLVIYREARTAGGPFFVLACLAKPIFSNLSIRSLWDKVCYAYVNNKHYTRLQALKKLAGGDFREDVLSGDLSSWIVEEYKQSRDKLGDASVDHPMFQYSKDKTPIVSIIGAMLDDLPMVYCGLNAILFPSRFSITSIAILQSSSTSLRYSIGMLFWRSEQFFKNINTVKELYSATHIENKLANGQVEYPPVGKPEGEGMSFDLKNLSFAYPGSHKKTNALNNINLTIPGGSLIVIVGGNGSGKSTIVRVLSRLFDPTSGELQIDGHPAQEYNMADLRRASTLLSQDNKIYPLPFAENIGLGCIEHLSNMELIKKAAEQGGATEFISKLETGFDTTLDNATWATSMNLIGTKDHPLKQQMEKLEKKVSVSGGERQRLVAARSFMRLNSGKVRYIAVDEPSSALDAEANSNCSTTFWSCMKDGSIAETGSHEDLLQANGEYAKLYNIQANAFSEPTETEKDA